MCCVHFSWLCQRSPPTSSSVLRICSSPSEPRPRTYTKIRVLRWGGGGRVEIQVLHVGCGGAEGEPGVEIWVLHMGRERGVAGVEIRVLRVGRGGAGVKIRVLRVGGLWGGRGRDPGPARGVRGANGGPG